MVVDKKTLNKWKLIKEQGDQTKIAIASKKTKQTISRAFLGRCSQETIDAINNYYKL